MSLYQKASLVQIPSGYKAADDKLYSVVPNNGDGDFTVTVAAGATRVNKDGLVETVAANQARLNYDPTNPQDPHLLLEPSRQNYTAYSAQFDNSYWTKATSDTTANPTVTANVGTSPDGGSNADRVQLTAPPDNSWAVVKRDSINTGATVGSKLQQSLYLKAYDSSQVGKKVDIYMYDFSNTVYKTVYNYTLTADWERVVVEHTISGANTSTNIQFAFGKARSSVGGSSQAETATDFLVWGSQLEEGTYPTSYIPTSGSAVTRTADFCNIPSGAASVINSFKNEGTIFLDFEVPTVDPFFQITISNLTSGGNRIILNFISNEIRFQVLQNGSGAVGSVFANTPVSYNQRIKLAGSFKTGAGILYKNGSLADDIDTSFTCDFGDTLQSVKFSGAGNTAKFTGKIYQFMYFDTALSQSELATLTS